MLTEEQADKLLELVESTRHAARQEHRGTAEAGRKTDESWIAVLAYVSELTLVSTPAVCTNRPKALSSVVHAGIKGIGSPSR